MKNEQKNWVKYVWFSGGFVLGLTLISLGNASIPKRVATTAPATVSEIKGGKVGSPNLDQDFSQLNSLEARYAESYDQQQRLRGATSKVARTSAPTAKVQTSKKKAQR